MRWSERPPVARLRFHWLGRAHRDPRSLPVAVAHLILVRSMRVAVILVTAWLVPCLAWSAAPSFVPARPEDFVLRSTSGVAPPFRSAQSVEVFRVAPRSDKRQTTRRFFHDQKVIAGPRRLSSARARALGEELERAYRIDWPNLYCAFVARYGVRLYFPTHSVEVLVCPHCGEVNFYRRGQWFRRASLAGRLLPLLRKAFPDHPLRENET
jgi:hypothetical protein